MVISLRLSLHGFGEGTVLVLNEAEPKDGRKTGNVGLESRTQVSEESGLIQDPVQFIGRNKT